MSVKLQKFIFVKLLSFCLFSCEVNEMIEAEDTFKFSLLSFAIGKMVNFEFKVKSSLKIHNFPQQLMVQLLKNALDLGQSVLLNPCAKTCSH